VHLLILKMATTNKCFDNIIGLRNSCNSIDSTSGLFINDIGISLNELNEFVSEDFSDGEELFTTQKNLAINYVATNIHTYFSQRYKVFSLVENRRVGFYQDNVVMLAGGAELKGMMIDMDNKGSFISFHLNELSLQTNFNGTIPVLVYDLIQGVLIDTINVTSTANQTVTIYPNKVYQSNKNRLNLFIGYDTTGINYIRSSATQSAGCISCNKKPYYNNEFVTISCAKTGIATPKILNNIDSSNDCGGMSMLYSLNCNHENWLCNVSNMIALPILYKTAAFIMEYGIYITPNEMLTNRSTMNRDLLKERLTSYENKFSESMQNILNNIELPFDDRCFLCKQQSRTTIMLP
jgi:hypothetical protein